MSSTTIYSINEMTEGLFGMVILFMFEVLPILETENLNIAKLKWDIRTSSYGSIFPNLLEYNEVSLLNTDVVEPSSVFPETNIPLFQLRTLYKQWVLGDDFESLHRLFFKYFRIPTYINAFADSLGLNDCVGIHFRGSDKTTDLNMNTPLSIRDFYVILDSYLNANKNVTKIFIATDEPSTLEYLISKYSHIEFKTSRSLNGNLFWRNNENTLKNGIEAMVDMVCLSKCKVVLKGSSALSSFSKVINPDLTIYRLNALKMFVDIPYFPDAYIPLLEKSEQYSSECNFILDKVQQDDWSILHKPKFNNFFYKPR